MNKYFSSASKVLENRAEHIAQLLGHDYLGTEHVLVAYVTLEEPHTRLDERLTTGAALDQMISIVGMGGAHLIPGTTPSPRLQQIMSQAGHEAEQEKRTIEPHHILDCILKEGEGVACMILVRITHTNTPELRQKLANLMTSN